MHNSLSNLCMFIIFKINRQRDLVVATQNNFFSPPPPSSILPPFLPLCYWSWCGLCRSFYSWILQIHGSWELEPQPLGWSFIPLIAAPPHPTHPPLRAPLPHSTISTIIGGFTAQSLLPCNYKTSCHNGGSWTLTLHAGLSVACHRAIRSAPTRWSYL